MDADEQGPAQGQTDASAARPGSGDADRAEREAASRSAHPSHRRPRATAQSPVLASGAAAAHFERTSVSWLAANLHHLGSWPTDQATRGASLAAVGDVALLVGLRLRSDPSPMSSDYSTLVDALAEIAGRPHTRLLLQQDRRALLPLVALHAALLECGRGDAALALAIDAALAERSVPGLARTAEDQILLQHLLTRSDLAVPCPQTSGLLTTSLLADDVVSLELTRDDVHALTWTILSCGDFGSIEIPWPAGTTPREIAELLREWLLLAMADEDAELVGELLMGLTCLAANDSALAATARRWLRGWQESDGRVEGRPLGLEGTVTEPEWTAWLTGLHATVVLAMESLLLRTVTSSAAIVTEGSDPTGATDPRLPDLAATIAAAAQWLDAVLPDTHVQGRLWACEAWLALGDEEEARRQLQRLAEDPQIAFTVLKESGEQAVHLAALVVGLGVDSPPLVDLCQDVAALLTHPDAAQVLLASARQRAEAATTQTSDDIPLAEGDAQLRERTRALSAELQSRGGSPDPRSSEAVDELMLLARGARAAAAAGDAGWLAAALRGLHRLRLAPTRLVRDVTVLLSAHQRADGAIGAPVDVPGIADRQVRWTLQALPALLEEVRAMQLPGRADLAA